MPIDTAGDPLDSGTRVLPLVSEPGNRRMLTEWLEAHSSYEAVALSEDIHDTSFDVCIIDEGAFEEHFDSLRAKKKAAAPVLLPYLLLLPDSGVEIIDTDAGELADNVVSETVDEIVSLPMKQAELHWRVTALLRLRNQSLVLREREEDLEMQVDLFEKAQNIANVGAWEYDIESEKNWWTEEVYRIYGLPKDTELTPEEGIQYYHPDDRSVIEEAFQQALEDGEPYDIEVRFIDAEDNHGWVRTRGEPQYEDGELTRVRGTIQDITESKEREQELERAHDLFREAEKIGAIGAWEIDTDGTQTWTDGTRRIHEVDEGFTPTIEEGIEFYHQADREEIEQAFEAAVEHGEPYDRELRIITAQGNQRWIRTRGKVIDTGESQIVRGFIQDISLSKERERDLQRRTQAIDEAPIGITISDPDQEDNPLIYANDAFEEMTGYPQAEILGENCRFLQGENTDSEQVAAIREAIDAKEPVSVELRNYRKDGSEFWNHLEIAPVRDDAGEVVNYIGFQRDITARKERQRQLDIIDRVLRHNLRNDMNVIRGQAEVIQSKTSGEISASAKQIMDASGELLGTADEERNHISRIRSWAERIHSTSSGEVETAAEAIINMSDELIGMADTERQITELLREEPTQREIDVGHSLTAVASSLGSRYPEATFAIDCTKDVTVQASSNFEQAIRELMTNAVIHNTSSSPEVTLNVTQTDETVRIEISDNGPVIPEIEKALLTLETEQTPLEHARGFGLWLVKLIVTRSDGTITVEENSQAGNLIRIDLPR